MRALSPSNLAASAFTLAALAFGADAQIRIYDTNVSASRTSGLSADGRAASGNALAAHPNDPNRLANQAFHWNDTNGFELFSIPSSTTSQSSSGISGDGRYVVGAYDTRVGPDGQPAFLAYRQLRGGTTEFLPNITTGVASYAVAASFDGNVITGATTMPPQPGGEDNRQVQAFLWTPTGGTVGLGYLEPNGYQSVPQDISYDGTTVVGTSVDFFAGGPERPFRWTASTGMTELFVPDPANYVSPNVTAISGNGFVSVGSTFSRSTLFAVPVVWNNSAVAEVLPMDPAMVLANAVDVNIDGSVIVGRARYNGTFENAPVVWLNGAEALPIRLVDHLSSFGLELPDGWRFSEINSVSGDGMTFGGQVISPSQGRYAFIATVPSVSTVAWLGGLLVLSPVKRRRTK